MQVSRQQELYFLGEIVFNIVCDVIVGSSHIVDVFVSNIGRPFLDTCVTVESRDSIRLSITKSCGYSIFFQTGRDVVLGVNYIQVILWHTPDVSRSTTKARKTRHSLFV